MSQYKITKQRLAQIIKEEYEAIVSQELEEGYMDALDRSREEERRQKSYDYDARERERERNRRQGRTGGTRMGGSYEKKRFPGFNRDDEEAKPDYIDIDKDGDKDEPMKKAAKDKKMKKEGLDSIRALIQQELKNL